MRTFSRTSRREKQPLEPLDKMATSVILLMIGIIAAMLLLGSQALPKVRTFSWQDRAVSADDVAFMLTFTQPVEPASVEANLKIEPELAGKFSWAGRRMAYTLAVPAPYGETYTLSLPEANALNGQSGFEPFRSEFRTRDRIFAYIGADGEEKGRLVMFNFTRKEKKLLTPAGQTVLDFQPYPERDRILYLAASPAEGEENTLAFAELYSVATGIEADTTAPKWQIWRPKPADAGERSLILDNKDYQNLKFDLSPNGKVIVIQRVNQQNPADFGPWVLIEGEPPRKLQTEPGGDFRIAPDSASLLLQQGQGTAVIALTETDSAQTAPEAAPETAPEKTAKTAAKTAATDELLDFLPDYGLTLDIANNGSAAAFVNFNQDDPEKRFTQSLVWVSNRGEEKLLLQTDGNIVSAQFNEDNELLYCLVNRLVVEDDTNYLVMPYLTAINIKTGQAKKLIEMPPQPEITVSLSPDGLAILFDEMLVSDQQQNDQDRQAESSEDETLMEATHRLWLLPLFSTLEERLLDDPIPLPATELEIAGRQPMWLS